MAFKRNDLHDLSILQDRSRGSCVACVGPGGSLIYPGNTGAACTEYLGTAGQEAFIVSSAKSVSSHHCH